MSDLSRRLLRGLILAALPMAACSEHPPVAEPVKPVLVTTVRHLPLEVDRTFTAFVQARRESELAFRAGGRIVARLVEVGDAVVTGQPLARLDAAEYELALRATEEQYRAAEAEASQAVADSERLTRLLSDQSVAVADQERQRARRDAAVARQAQARHQVELARLKVRHAILRAEFDGVVVSRRFEVGQVVAEGHPLLGLARLTDLELVADLPEALAPRAASLVATGLFPAASQAPVALKLRELSPQAALPGRTFRARFTASEAPAALRPGMSASLRLEEREKDHAAPLPATSLLKTGGSPSVWRLPHGGDRLEQRNVRIVRLSGETVWLQGLDDGDRVVTAGVQKLDAGLTVRPVERSASGLERQGGAWR
ncbi:MAG: efflux RND transporter periplasmic adaptor subunit [Magnetococcales bacterium]|nr:efflux RND transporter periplasmic adaptor subunit [Magnetococcales bacterium]